MHGMFSSLSGSSVKGASDFSGESRSHSAVLPFCSRKSVSSYFPLREDGLLCGIREIFLCLSSKTNEKFSKELYASGKKREGIFVRSIFPCNTQLRSHVVVEGIHRNKGFSGLP